MVNAVLKIHLKQIYRGIKRLGILRTLFILPFVVYLIFAIFTWSTDFKSAIYVSVATLTVFGIAQIRRTDKKFLELHFHSFKFILFVEYLILAFPILFCFAVHFQWEAALMIIVGFLGIIHIKNRSKQITLNSKIQRIIPTKSFEWKAGIRKQLLFIVPLWILTLLFSPFVGTVPVGIMILGILSVALYEDNEPYQMILLYELTARQFLWMKIKNQIKLFTIITVPLIASFVIFHPQYWYISIIEFLFLTLIQTYAILVKYAFYESNSRSQASGIYITIGFIGAFIPIVTPVVLLLMIRFYMSSIKKLNPYLDDFN